MKLIDFGSLDFVPGLICLVNFFIAYLVFANYTAHPIEKKIKEVGGDLPQWDNIGLRISAYCIALLMPIKVTEAQLVDENLLRKFAKPVDHWRARYLFGSLVLFFLVAFIT